jgi:hypothetical protein
VFGSPAKATFPGRGHAMQRLQGTYPKVWKILKNKIIYKTLSKKFVNYVDNLKDLRLFNLF